MDKFALRRQFEYLRKLRAMPVRKLKALHERTFGGSKFDVTIRLDADRGVYERRLWLLFCARNYHLDASDERARQFKRWVKRELSGDYIHEDREVEIKARNQSYFTYQNIQEMPLKEVERALVAVGIHVDGRPKLKRRCLWEYYNLPGQRIPRVRSWRKKAGKGNKFVLRDLIKHDPGMTYQQFLAWYGDAMPDTTSASFYNARSHLKKKGYEVQNLYDKRSRKRRNE